MFKYYRPRIRSRHPSHSPLRVRGVFPLYPFKSVIRFGSSKEYADSVSSGGDRVEINTVQAVKNSSSKKLMKDCFTNESVKTADWWLYDFNQSVFCHTDKMGEEVNTQLVDLPFPIISKSYFGSRNKGNTKHNTVEELSEWLEGKDTSKYLFEKYYNYAREYRLHISPNGCFYTCRKMLKSDTEDKDKWYRNDDHCVWILEENELFDKPSNWDKVVLESVKALHAVGLDIGAVDLRIQSATDKHGVKRQDPDFIIVEINSAPSFGEVTINKYKKELTLLLTHKNENRK
jgi:D-alanine-D-alanine ligase-like ATP-grasp enzyme